MREPRRLESSLILRKNPELTAMANPRNTQHKVLIRSVLLLPFRFDHTQAAAICVGMVPG